MKSKFAEIYATYVGIRMLGLFAPASFLAKLNDMASIAPTLAFSNMPGILTPINFGDQKCHKMVNSFNSAGRVALTIAFISYCGSIRSSICADTCVMDNPSVLAKELETALDELVAMAHKKTDEK